MWLPVRLVPTFYLVHWLVLPLATLAPLLACVQKLKSGAGFAGSVLNLVTNTDSFQFGGSFDLHLHQDRGKNGSALLSETVEDWCLNRGVLQLMAPGVRDDPRHYDGGASLILATLTLWGHRSVKLHVKDPESEEIFNPKPGNFYVATMCAIEHQVSHNDHEGIR